MSWWRARWRAWWGNWPVRRLKVTRLGRTYLVLTVGIGLGALNTGNNLLYLLLGLMLSVIVMSGVLSEQAIIGLKIRRVVPDGAFAGEPFPMRYEVSRTEGRSFALRFSEAGSGLEGAAWAPLIEPGEPSLFRGDFKASRRGPVRLNRLEISTVFPLGLFEKTREIEIEDLLVVYPRRGFACQPPGGLEGRQSGDAGSPRLRDGTGDLMGLRELAPGEDARRVHWKKSASAGVLLRVEREREDRRQYLLEVDASATPDHLERACEETAAVAHVLLAEGHEVGLHAGRRKLRPTAGPGHEKRLLAALAWAGFEEPHP